MADFSGPNIADAYAQGQQIGENYRQRKRDDQYRQGLASYLTSKDPEGLKQAFTANPEGAFSAQKAVRSREGEVQQKAANFTRIWQNSRPDARPALIQSARRVISSDPEMLALLGDSVPQTDDPAEWDNFMGGGALLGQPESFSNAGGGMMLGNQGTARKIDGYQAEQDWKMEYIPDPSDPNYEIPVLRSGAEIRGLDGTPMFGGQPQAPMPQQGPADPQGIQANYQNLASQFPGTQITSLQRTQQHNRDVGGVPNSQHVKGTAGDFVVPQEQRAAFIAKARAEGYEAIDEGDHVHVELPPGGRQSAPQQGAPIRRARYKDAADKGAYVNMSAEEVQALGLPAGTVAQRSPTGQIQIVNKPRDIPGAQTQVIDNPDGTQTIIPAGKTTEDQNKSAGYGIRMENALADIAAAEAAAPGSNRPGMGVALLDTLPDAISNYGKSEGRQNVEAAQLDALDAALTLNTGAAYTKEQLKGLSKAYFPQPGDGKSVIEGKTRRLEKLIQTARLRARGAYPTTGANAPNAADADRRQPPLGGPPQRGEEIDGYRFKGGNPADKNSWEKI